MNKTGTSQFYNHGCSKIDCFSYTSSNQDTKEIDFIAKTLAVKNRTRTSQYGREK